MDFSNDVALLNEIYQGAVMGSEAISSLLPKVKSPSFRSDLKLQYDSYQDIARQADEALKGRGSCPRELKPMQKAGLRMGTWMNTLANEETAHLAEMMIQGSNMGILSLTKVLSPYNESGSDARQLAAPTLAMEEDNIRRMKGYLQ